MFVDYRKNKIQIFVYLKINQGNKKLRLSVENQFVDDDLWKE